MRAKGEGKRKVRKKIDKRRKKGEKRKSGEEEERDKLVKVKRRVRKSKIKKWVQVTNVRRTGLQFLRGVTNTKTIRAKVECKGTRYTLKTIKSLSNT